MDATNKAEVTAYDDSYVSLAWGSVGKAYGNAEVFTVGCKVEAFENARVDARGDAVVIAHDNASVDARDRTAVHAKGSGKITLKGDAFLADPA